MRTRTRRAGGRRAIGTGFNVGPSPGLVAVTTQPDGSAIAGRSDGGRSCHHTAGGIGAAVAVGTGAGNGSSATGAVVGAGAKHHHATRYVVASPLIVHSRSARPSTFHRGPRRAGRSSVVVIVVVLVVAAAVVVVVVVVVIVIVVAAVARHLIVGRPHSPWLTPGARWGRPPPYAR